MYDFACFFTHEGLVSDCLPTKQKQDSKCSFSRNFNVGKKFQKSLDFVMITKLVDYHQFFFIVTMTICSGLPLYNLQALIAIVV